MMSIHTKQLSFINRVFWFCFCLCIGCSVVLAQPIQRHDAPLPESGLSADSETLSTTQISALVSADITRQKTSQFVRWLKFSPVPDAINLVHGLITDPDMGIVQKEAVLLRLTQYLRSFQPTPTNRAVMLELTTYKSTVLTEHHDDPRFTQPAFNIAASARGAINEWRYQGIKAQLNSANVMPMWNAANQQERRYILTSLRNGSIPQQTLVDIHTSTIQQHSKHPDLAMTAAFGSGNIQSAAQLAIQVTPQMALDILKAIALNNTPFGKASNIELLKSIGNHSDPAISSIALNALAHSQADNATMASLINQLSDSITGVSAAMTLAQIMTDSQINDLRVQTDQNNQLLQSRIKLIGQLRKELQQ